MPMRWKPSGSCRRRRSADESTVTLKLPRGQRCALLCMKHSVLWVSPVGLRALAIENDPMSGNARHIVGQNFSRTLPSRSGGEAFTIASEWVNIDDQFG